MRNWMQVLSLATIVLVGAASARETPYYKSVSDIEVETAVKGCTYNKGPSKWFESSSSNSSKCCECQTCQTCATNAAPTTSASAPAPVTTTASADGRRIKYILDGKPVYEDEGRHGPDGPEGCAMPAPGEKLEAQKTKAAPVSDDDVVAAINRLGTSGWRDAQALLISAGKAAVPHLIDALSRSDDAYNLEGHTKADLGRASRTFTIGEVCAELLANIVENHSSYNGEVPALSQAAWRDWWNKNGASVTFAN
ncbi:MAG TPA: hypothetical protein VKX17_22095 [Planctomycetota bacterium]|nr:hypothetical protein [Planctomycetota bacterium]